MCDLILHYYEVMTRVCFDLSGWCLFLAFPYSSFCDFVIVDRGPGVFSCFKPYFHLCVYFILTTEKALISLENDNSDSGIFVPKPDHTTSDASKSSCQSDMDSTNKCSEQETNLLQKEMLWKNVSKNQNYSVTQDSKENLPPLQPFTSKTHPQIPAIPPATSALINPSAHTTLQLDLSSPVPPDALNDLKSQVVPQDLLCGQATASPAEMKSLEKGNQKQISHTEEKLMPRMSHRLSSGLLKEPVVTPGKNVENTQLEAQSNSATSVLTVDGTNLVEPGTTT